MRKVERFEVDRWYEVIEDCDVLDGGLLNVCDKLRVGERLKFQGKNLGYARFQTTDGRLVFVEPKTVFRVIGEPEKAMERCGGEGQ